jgi:hypothetical protein
MSDTNNPVLVWRDEDHEEPLGPEREDFVIRNGAMLLKRATLPGGCVLLTLRQPPGNRYR